MRAPFVPLSLKFALLFTATALAVLSVASGLSVRREIALFDHDVRRDNMLLGESMATALGAVWRRGGEPELERVMAALAARRGPIRLVWWPAKTLVAHAVLPDERERLHRGEPIVGRVAGPHGEFSSLFPVIDPLSSQLLGALSLTQPVSEHDAYVATTIRRAAATTAALAAFGALASLVLGAIFVGRPSHALVTLARRIGAGDFSARSELRQRDELGMLSHEMNAMSAQLADARDRVNLATQARITAVEQMRHSDRLATVGKLAAGLAHELGTPLNVVAARAKLAGSAAEPDVRDHARIVGEQAAHMTRIIRQLLDFARRRPPRRAPEKATKLARNTANLLDSMARKRGVELVVEGPPDDVVAPVDPGQFQQVLTNLLVNAIQAMTAGGKVWVQVAHVDAVAPADHPQAGTAIACASVSVRDEGPGIPPELQSRIFEPFFTTKEVGEGTGLGLSVTHGLVADHGGWISVDSPPGAGATFTVFFPLGLPAESAS